MFHPDHPLDLPTGELLAELGVRPELVREVIAEDRALRCADRETVFPEQRIADFHPAPACRPAPRRSRRA